MKRLLSILMVMLFCLTMAVPAMAAEPEEYIFELMPPISVYSDFEFILSDYFFMHEGYIPEGQYYLYFFRDGALFGGLPSPINVFYSLQELNNDIVNCSLSTIVLGEGEFQFLLVDLLSDYGFTLAQLINGAGDFFSGDITSFKMVPVSNGDQLSAELLDLIHTVLFGDFMITGTLVGLSLFKGNRYA